MKSHYFTNMYITGKIGRLSRWFNLRKSQKKRCLITILSIFSLGAQDSDLPLFLENLSRSEKPSEIKPFLVHNHKNWRFEINNILSAKKSVAQKQHYEKKFTKPFECPNILTKFTKF